MNNNEFKKALNKITIVVLGMHRSGTSALTGTLKLLGADLGQILIPADLTSNIKGHWEAQAVVDMNDHILATLNRSWQDESAMPKNWLEQSKSKQNMIKIEEIISRLLTETDNNLWAIKDPRLCCLLPIWLPTINHLSTPFFLLSLRHPKDVANSLMRRNNIPLIRGYLLWARYMLDAELHSRNYNRLVINYDALINNWENELAPLLSALKIKTTPEINSTISNFITPTLRHSSNKNSVYNVSSEPYALATDIYNNLIQHKENVPSDQFDQFRHRLETYLTPHHPWIEQIQHLHLLQEQTQKIRLTQEQKIISFENKIKNMSTYERTLIQEIARVKSSLSWRITKPLRFLINLFNGNIFNRFYTTSEHSDSQGS